MFAYIDPGAGGLLTQLLLGGAAGLAVYVKFRWNAIRGLLGRREVEGAAENVSTTGGLDQTSGVEGRATV